MKSCISFEEYVPGIAIAKSKNFINLASNENPYGPSPKALEAFRSFSDLHKYPDPRYEELKQRIVEYTGWNFEEIAITSGIDGALETIFRFAVGEGDEVLIAPPTFSYYRILAKLSCARVVEAGRDEDFRLKNCHELVTKKTKLAIFCSPNNPTGKLEDFEEIKAVAEVINGVVVVDEAYVEFAEKRFPCMDNVIIVRTFSKAFGLANLRVGYARIPQIYLKAFKSANTPFPISTAAEKAAIAALNDLEWMKSCVDKIKKDREKMYNFLKKYFKTYPSDANFLLFKGGKGLHETLAEKGILIRECSQFGLPNYYRVTVGKEEENRVFMEVLECLLQ
ncbi:MAG: histidinol-phosphate transaminase [Archaeoglobaceae archaeon]|nr:histidinol-phosphate transaminase [Archaeoglobaceae archaeon]MCX8151952.1 histidinol-phosphate transaminase [Archaeoglobaceae archaeon]MDW8013341.1 histidinol-phosphate transaminase [Archaeoglobaceae archaeon]